MPHSASSLGQEPLLRVLLMGYAKIGKAQPVGEPVLTPTGWRTMGELQVGDLVIGSDGKPTRILAVHPQGVKSLVRMIADDGAQTRCCPEHLWRTTTKAELLHGRFYTPRPSKDRSAHRPRYLTGQVGEGSVKTAADIARTLEEVHYLPRLTNPILFDSVERPTIDPYFLGLLIGDGSYAGTNQVTFTSQDDELLIAAKHGFDMMTDEGVIVRPVDGRCPYVRVRGVRTRDALKAMGLYGSTSETKDVPSWAVFGSVETRLEFLRGLCDTDGSAVVRENASGHATQAEYVSTSPRLAEAVVHIVRSLGGRARCVTKATSCQTGPGLPAFRVLISFDDGLCPFKLKRKASRWQSEKLRDWRPRIVAVEPAGESECVCITVDVVDSLYVTRDFLLTHNSTSTIVSLSSAFGKGYVICCGDKNGMGPAKRRTTNFDYDIVRDERDMEACIKEARQAVKDNNYKWLFVDDFSLYASMLEGALRDASAKLNNKNEPDGRRYWPEFKQRLLNVPLRLFDLNVHVVFATHWISATQEIDGQRPKAGKGIVPMISGSAREELPTRFTDVLFMEKEKDNRRVFQVNPEGVWGPGCRSVDGQHTIDADFGEFIKLSKESIKLSKESNKVIKLAGRR